VLFLKSRTLEFISFEILFQTMKVRWWHIPRSDSANSSQWWSIILIVATFAAIVSAIGGLNGLPVLNGPINPVSNVYGMKSRVGDCVHPGLWHTHDDLERIRIGVVKSQDPWKTAFINFSTDSFSQASASSQMLLNIA
jgi:hypothetical protein